MFAKWCGKNSTCAAWSLTLLRVVTGLLLINHGWPKLFSEPSVKAGMLAFFESTVLPAPGAMLLLAGILEVVGGLLLILGAFTVITTTVLMVEFAVIVLFIKLTKGFSSMETDLLIFSVLLALHASGAGAMSVESMLDEKKGLAGGGHGPEAMSG